MNTLKKLITLLALLLPVTAIALPPTDYINYEFEVDGIYYKIVDDAACVTYRSYESGNHIGGYAGDVVIPSTVAYQGKTYPVTMIDSYAFNYCQGLRSITIPESIKMIGGSAFYLCTGLTRVTITDIEAWCRCIIVGTDSNPLFYAQHLYLNDTEVTDLTIPDGITAIGKNAFLGWAGLTSVTIPNSVTSIGDNAFNGCTGLTSLSIPNSVTEIGQVAFEGCTSLTSVTLGNAVTTIGGSAFAGCTALTGIVIPNSVTSIGSAAFSGCTSLASATIGKCVTSIGASAFRNCASLTSIEIPNSVTEIGTFAFSGCSELSSVTIGSAVTTIGKDAFQNDPSIEAVTSKATTPPSWGDLSMFTTNVYNHAPLHVPTDSERAYKTNQYWGQFLTIIGDVTNDNPSGDEDGYEYVPFVREGVKWVYYFQESKWDCQRTENTDSTPNLADDLDYNLFYRTLEIKGDTVINGKLYKAMHKYSGDSINTENDTIPIYLREENKIVYGIVPDRLFYSDCPIGNVFSSEMRDALGKGEEFVLYDFNDPVSYWESHANEYQSLYIDTISIGSHMVKRYAGELYGTFYIVEGVGIDDRSSYPLFFFMPMFTGSYSGFSLSHVIEDGEIIYKGINYKEPEPEPEPQESDYLPIAREGVKWVNEKVIVNHGDTTRYYYCYEICGNDTTWPNMINKVYKACYYYTGNELDVNTDSLIAGLDSSKEFTTCGRNDAYQEIRYQNKNLISFGQYTGDGQDTFLYYFLEGEGPEPDWDNTIEYYLACQQQSAPTPEDQTLTHENFTQVDPVEIEGVTCRRWCYTGENGEPLAYIIEGIGFDSRDMGDLLTPFTRRPDPNADYQEWCGLSHVIKDGKIIYKGMRYRPHVPGDVNGDGETTIADANSVIDVVIMGGNAGHNHMPAADANGDGEVNIADVNAIIDMILSQHLE